MKKTFLMILFLGATATSAAIAQVSISNGVQVGGSITGCAAQGTNTLQKSNGVAGCASSALSDNGTTVTSTEPLSATQFNAGTLPSAYARILPLGTPTSWAFDTTSPSTALGSIFSYPGAGIPNSTGSAWGTSYGTVGGASLASTTSVTVNGNSTDVDKWHCWGN